MFSSSELTQVLVGLEELNLNELKEKTSYKDGYDENSD